MAAPVMPFRGKTLATHVLEAAATQVGDAASIPRGARSVSFQVKLVVAGGGTTCKTYLQTSFDGGLTWVDIACVALTASSAVRVGAVKGDIARAVATPTDGALADNTILDGILGDRLRAKTITTGTYTGASSVATTVVFDARAGS